MAIRIKNAAAVGLGADASAGKGASAATVAFRIKFNWPPPAGAGPVYVVSGVFTFSVSSINSGADLLNIYSLWGLPGGYVTCSATVTANTPNHIVVAYDKDDPTKQGIYVNGDFYPADATRDVAFGENDPVKLQIGTLAEPLSTTIDCTIEDVFSVVGYAVTPAEVIALRDGADPATIGVGATLRGHWPLTGTTGDPVAAESPGIANTLAGGFASTIGVGETEGSSLTFADPIPYASPVGPGDFAVYSSGKTVRVGFDTEAGAPIGLTPASFEAGSVTISIDGGDPVALERPLYTGEGTYAGVLLFTPDGVTIPPDVPVSVTTEDGWIGTSLGTAPGVTDLAIPNRSGKAVYGAMDASLRVGWGFAYDWAYWTTGFSMKNLAMRLDLTYGKFARRANGTAAEDVKRHIMAHSYFNPLDFTSNPMRYGLYALGYKPNSEGTAISLVSTDGALHQQGVQEVPGYGNTSGGRVVKVYDVQAPAWTVELAAPCSDSDTVLTLVSVADVANPSGYDVPTQHVKLGDEWVRITARDVGESQVTVTRGYYGSTASAHLAGTVGAMSCTTPYYDLSLDIVGPEGAPDYEDLVVFGPGDWDVPGSVEPVTLDLSPENLQEPPKTVRDVLANGAGILRYMSSTDGGYGFSSEPEHMRLDTDLYLAEDVKFLLSARVVSSETATATNSPFVYSAYQLKNAVKYTVALAESIATAPAAGAIEVIKITYDAANPVMYGIRIEMPSGEVVRVIDVDGDDVTVVRGAEGTTPATQAAGSVLARWRVAASADSQYETLGNARTLCTTAENHGLWTRCHVGLPASNDLNPLARIEVTLTADVTTLDQTVFSVSVAAADAPYLAPGLFIVFRNECVRVTDVDLEPGEPYTGTITVARADAWALAGRLNTMLSPPKSTDTPPNGTVGTGSSGGVYCESADAAKHCWSYGAGWTAAVLVTGPKSFVVRQYNMTDIAQVWHQVGVQPRDPILDDTTADVRTSGPFAGYSFAQSARVTKSCPGAVHWVCIPEFASNDLVDEIARQTLAVLPAGQHSTAVELGNELWHFGTPRLEGANEIAVLCGYEYAQPGVDLLIHRSWAAAQRFKAIFAAAGRGSEVKWAVPWQQGAVGMVIARCKALEIDDDLDIVSSAPYVYPQPYAEVKAAYNAATDEECLDIWKFHFEYCTSDIGGMLYADGKARRDYEAESGRSLQFLAYEGGPDCYVPAHSADITNGVARGFDLNYNPHNYFASYDLPYSMYRRGGMDGIALFQFTGLPFWNVPEQMWSSWGAHPWQGQPAGRGDGSDDKADNRLCLVTPGREHTKHPTVSQDASNVSVRGQAVLDYNAAYAEYNSPDPDPGTPSPHGGSVFLMGF